MIERFAIAGYARISVDEELDRDNVSIENQKAIIEDFVKHRFPDSTLTFYEDRDRSGYTFEQREGYQEMRRGLRNFMLHVPPVAIDRKPSASGSGMFGALVVHDCGSGQQ